MTIRDEVVASFVSAYKADDYDTMERLIPTMTGDESRAAMTRLGLGHIL